MKGNFSFGFMEWEGEVYPKRRAFERVYKAYIVEDEAEEVLDVSQQSRKALDSH